MPADNTGRSRRVAAGKLRTGRDDYLPGAGGRAGRVVDGQNAALEEGAAAEVGQDAAGRGDGRVAGRRPARLNRWSKKSMMKGALLERSNLIAGEVSKNVRSSARCIELSPNAVTKSTS